MEFSATFLLSVLIVALLWFVSGKNTKKYRLPPGPSPLPLIGNLLQLEKTAPFKSFLEFSKTYGPVMTFNLGWQRVVVLVGYDAVKEALVDQADDFTGRAPVAFLYRATRGYGIGISNGERWRQLRRFTLSTLRDFGMGRKGMEEWIQEESKHLRARMRSYKGEPFDPTSLLSRTVSNVVCCLVFGQRFSYEDKHFVNLLAVITMIVRFNSSPKGVMYNIFPWLMERLPGKQHAVFAKVEEIRDFVQTKIREHEDSLDPSSPRDFIDCFLIRGHETPCPAVFPQDTVIVPLLHSVLKEEKQWATPHSFNPQHFLDQNGNFKKNPAFLPFSAGKRACVGESLARMELFIFIVSLLQDFTFTCPGGPDSINLVPEYSSFANVPRSHKIIATPR
ncbi:cytochrome P450 2G1-like [Poecilia reticulata]|uniref:cytochrome P450 2G1-like n=1 Tax=Poecilia reticulata TaxID=8081 RepID=UPI0007EAE2D1|nr:PREDICTED: cytochrome P450 2G1-like [Poecilia reticulata]